MKLKNKNLGAYLAFICKVNSLQISNEVRNKILNHIDKLDTIILVVLNTYILILSFLSKIIFFKPLRDVKDSQIALLRKLLFVFYFFIKKIDQIIFVIANLHIYGDEELKEIPLSSYKNNDLNHFKFIVIGSGPAGSVTASELAKIYGNKVLIIEKGDYYEIPKSKHPGEEFSKKWYRGGINSTYFKEMIAYSSGSCFGGGSEINSGLYHRPDAEFLKEWQGEYSTIELDQKSIDEFSLKVENLINIEEDIDERFSNIFVEGAKIGKEKYSNLNKFYDSNTKTKNSMSETLLKDFLKNDGNVALNTDVKKIWYEDSQWKIKSRQGDKLKYFSCDYLFLCCGSIFTNKLLLKSAISKEKKKIISSFTFHPMIKMIGTYKEDLQDLNDDVNSYQNMNFWPNFIIGNASSSIQFLTSSFQESIHIKKFIEVHWKKMKVFHATFSVGFGKIISLPFIKEPVLFYFIKNSDKKIIQNASLKLFNFIKNTGANFIIPITEKNSEIIETNKEDNQCLLETTKKFQISSVHVLGGVTMGENENCVSNSFGKINNYKNLYVNDSSLINTKLLKNPQGTIMMIAYRNISNFLQSL